MLFALASVYLYFYLTKTNEVERIMIVIIGALLVVLGIVCIVNMIKKVRNTKQALIDQEMNKEPTYNTSNEVVNHAVKVADLKKESHKKRRNRQKASNTLEETKEIKVLPASDDSSSENKEQK